LAEAARRPGSHRSLRRNDESIHPSLRPCAGSTLITDHGCNGAHLKRAVSRYRVLKRGNTTIGPSHLQQQSQIVGRKAAGKNGSNRDRRAGGKCLVHRIPSATPRIIPGSHYCSAPVLAWMPTNNGVPINLPHQSLAEVGNGSGIAHEFRPPRGQEHHAITRIAQQPENCLTPARPALNRTQAFTDEPDPNPHLLHGSIP
jgi:hypothetical protein